MTSNHSSLSSSWSFQIKTYQKLLKPQSQLLAAQETCHKIGWDFIFSVQIYWFFSLLFAATNKKKKRSTSAMTLSTRFLSQTKSTLLLYGARPLSWRCNWDDLDYNHKGWNEKINVVDFFVKAVTFWLFVFDVAIKVEKKIRKVTLRKTPPAPHDAGNACQQLTTWCALSHADVAHGKKKWEKNIHEYKMTRQKE